jgi:hypothetical protein
MQICVAGWYYFKQCLAPLSNCLEVFIVAHRPGDSLNIPCTIIENIGLEFNCYDYFVKNIWDKKSDVLFCHDDIEINDISFIKDLENTNDPIIMIWHNEKHRKRNLAHGRMFKCNVQYLKDTGGFWWDCKNMGYLNTSGPKECNVGIQKLYQSTKKIIKHFYSNKIKMGFRGKI